MTTQILRPPFLHCPLCALNGKKSRVKMFEINMEEGVYLCSEDKCPYPLGYDDFAYINMNQMSYREQLKINHELSKLWENEVPSQDIPSSNIDVISENEIEKLLQSSTAETEINLNENNILVDGLLSMLEGQGNEPFADSIKTNEKDKELNCCNDSNLCDKKNSFIKENPKDGQHPLCAENSTQDGIFKKNSGEPVVDGETLMVSERKSCVSLYSFNQINAHVDDFVQNQTSLIEFSKNKKSILNSTVNSEHERNSFNGDVLANLESSNSLKNTDPNQRKCIKRNNYCDSDFLKKIIEDYRCKVRPSNLSVIKNPQLIGKLREMSGKHRKLDGLNFSSSEFNDKPLQNHSSDVPNVMTVHIDYSQLPVDGNTAVPFKLTWNNIDLNADNTAINVNAIPH